MALSTILSMAKTNLEPNLEEVYPEWRSESVPKNMILNNTPRSGGIPQNLVGGISANDEN